MTRSNSNLPPVRSGSLCADEGVMAGTVVVPHGLPGTNVNILIGSHPSLIEPLSGMHRMSGHRVELRKLRPS